MEMYPLLFKPIIKTLIWGQESWDISCRPMEMGIIANGLYAGMAFEDYLNLDRKKTMGTALAELTRFPLLVKIITARDILSVQVHPDDAYAQAQGSEDSGKSEMWYIIEPPTDGHLIMGLREGVTRSTLRRAYETGHVEDCLHRLAVKKGDLINIPAGLVHALTPGAVIAEIQQNSDTTYRLYDYHRTGPDGNPRELHIEHALAVADFDRRIPIHVTDEVHSDFFSVKYCALEHPLDLSAHDRTFRIVMCVTGEMAIGYDGKEMNLAAGESVFLPAGMPRISFVPTPKAALLLCTLPR